MKTGPQGSWTRRRWLKAALVAGAPALGFGGYRAAAAPREVVIKMTVKRFEFSRKEIVIKVNVPVVIEITSLDVVHGFSVPEFKARADAVLPGKVTQVRFTPDKTGEFQYLCDIFCGDRHEEVEGRLIVKA